MSITSGFFDSVANDRRYDAAQMSNLFEGIINDGVFLSLGTALMIRPSTGMNIIVGEGRAWFNGTWTKVDSEFILALEPSDLILPRIDVVVLEVNKTDPVRANTIKVLTGTPGTVPVAPTLITSEFVNQYPLAHISVPAGLSEIAALNITNDVGTAACPFVTGLIDQLTIDTLLDQLEAINQADWDAWFDTIKGQLSTEVATALLTLIDALTVRVNALEVSVLALETKTNILATPNNMYLAPVVDPYSQDQNYVLTGVRSTIYPSYANGKSVPMLVDGEFRNIEFTLDGLAVGTTPGHRDVFCRINNSGVNIGKVGLYLGPVWTLSWRGTYIRDTAQELENLDGILVNKYAMGANPARSLTYQGTTFVEYLNPNYGFYWSAIRRGLGNRYNKRPFTLTFADATSHTYTSPTPQYYRALTADQVSLSFVICNREDRFSSRLTSKLKTSAATVYGTVYSETFNESALLNTILIGGVANQQQSSSRINTREEPGFTSIRVYEMSTAATSTFASVENIVDIES